MKPVDRLVWIDLETSGLDPVTDQILEVAIVVTDGKFNELQADHWVVKPAFGLPELEPAVLDMHSKSGLLGELHRGDPLPIVDVLATATVCYWAARGGPICGSTPQFDRQFIDRRMPLLAKCFNHRAFDASTLKLAWCLATGKEWSDGAEVVAMHRALADIRYSIACARRVSYVQKIELAP